MTESTTPVTIIIINYNTPELTTALIKSIEEHTTGVGYEIIVIDNGSSEGRRFRSQSHDRAVSLTVSDENLGFAKAANLAAKGASTPYLLFANSDSRVTSDVVPEMVRFLEEHCECAACSPKLAHEDGSVHSSLRHFPTYRNILFSRGSILASRENYTITADDGRKSVEAMSATFMMVKRDLFEEVGRFDERYFMYVEDTDLCRKFFDIGKQVVYLGDLNVVHHWGASTRLHPWRMKWEHHLSIRKYFLKHYPSRKVANFFLTFLLGVNYFLVSLKMIFSRRAR